MQSSYWAQCRKFQKFRNILVFCIEMIVFLIRYSTGFGKIYLLHKAKCQWCLLAMLMFYHYVGSISAVYTIAKLLMCVSLITCLWFNFSIANEFLYRQGAEKFFTFKECIPKQFWSVVWLATRCLSPDKSQDLEKGENNPWNYLIWSLCFKLRFF